MVTKIEADEMSFEEFANNFHLRIRRTLSIKRRLADQKTALLKKAKENPKIIYSNQFVAALRVIVSKDRMLHRLTEAALEKAADYLALIEGDVKGTIRMDPSKEAAKYLIRKKLDRSAKDVLDNLLVLLKYLRKRMNKLDVRLKQEEHFLETRDKKHFLKFLKSYKKELQEDLRLAGEFSLVEDSVLSSKIKLDRLENSLGHQLKRAGLKTAATAALPLTPALTALAKPVQLLIRPLSFLIVDGITLLLGVRSETSSETAYKRMSFKERIKLEVLESVQTQKDLVVSLLDVIKATDYPGMKKSHLLPHINL